MKLRRMLIALAVLVIAGAFCLPLTGCQHENQPVRYIKVQPDLDPPDKNPAPNSADQPPTNGGTSTTGTSAPATVAD